MKKSALFLCVIAFAGAVNASWYWPFGDDDGQPEPPRLSELMTNATELIDVATDLAEEGKIQESVLKYREALDELTRIESENPERAATTEFTSLRNKRAYVNAAIDSLLLSQARDNAKAVAVTDTTELEKKFLVRQGKLPPEVLKPAVERKAEEPAKTNAVPVAVPSGVVGKPAVAENKTDPKAKKAQKKSNIEKLKLALRKNPDNRKARLALIGEYIRAELYDNARNEIGVLLQANMTDSSALNLRAVCEASTGDFKAAENTLDLAIQSNPRDYNGYYNMANLKLQVSDNKDIARRYYETGRALGGPKDENLESALK